MHRPFAIAAIALMVAGCVSKPTIKLNHAEISGIQVGFPLQVSVVMRVVMEVYNPNSYDVAVRAVRGQTVLAEKYVLPVDMSFGPQGFWLPAKRTSALVVPVTIPVQIGLAVLGEAWVGASVPYRFSGKADVTATSTFALERDDYSVDERGDIPRAQFDAAIRSALPHF